MAPAEGDIAVGGGVTANFRFGGMAAWSSNLAEPGMERRIYIALDIGDDVDDLVHRRRVLRSGTEGQTPPQRKTGRRRAYGQEPTSINGGAYRGHGIYSA